MNKNVVLKIEDLSVHYGAIQAVKGIDLTVHEGDVIAILGANGAGKSSTLRAINGIVEAQGSVRFFDQEIINKEANQIAKLGIAQSPEGRAVFADLTVLENLKVGGFTVKKQSELKKNLEKVYHFFPVLKERKEQMASTLSGGEQQMLAIGRALMSSPKLLLLDEPSLGLAPLIVKDIMSIVKEIAAFGNTVIIVEQNAAQTLKIADYAYVMELGTITTEGTSDELLNNPALMEAYLGN